MRDVHPGRPGAVDGAAGAGSPPGGAGPSPRQLCDIAEVAGAAPSSGGALWKLAEPGRQLDANVVHLPSGRQVETHTEPDLDVLLLVVAGRGTLEGTGSTEQLAESALFWLPHGSTRRITAGAEGLSYLTVHRRRPGMTIRSRRDAP